MTSIASNECGCDMAAQVFVVTPTPIAACDGAAKLIHRNQAWVAHETEAAMAASDLRSWLSAVAVRPEAASRLTDELCAGCALQDGPEVVLALKEGKRRVWQFGSSPLPQGGYCIMAVDVTERRRDEEEAERMAYLDALTGLPNRRLFDDRLAQSLERLRRTGEGFAVHFIDLDRFKQVNDSMGHGAGDDLLRQVARRLGTSVRRVDTVARFGGDEFGVIQTGISGREAAEALALKLVRVLTKPFRIDGQQVQTGGSVGVAVAVDGVQLDANTLLDVADRELYRVKQHGRGSFPLVVCGRGAD